MFQFFSPAAPQLHLNLDQNDFQDVAHNPVTQAPRIPWLAKPIYFVQQCFDRAISHSLAYFAFPFLLDDLEDETSEMGGLVNPPGAAKVRPLKADAAEHNLILILLLAIRWLRAQGAIHKREQDKEMVESVVLQCLKSLKSSSGKPRKDQFCTCRAHCPLHATKPLPRLPNVYEDSSQLAPAFFASSRCQGYCNCPRYCEYNWPIQCTPFKAGIPIIWSPPSLPSFDFSVSLSVYGLKDQELGQALEETFHGETSANERSSKGDLRSDGDETNSDGAWSPIDDFLLPCDSEQEGEWDIFDAQGSDFEQRVGRKQAVRKSASQKGKDKRALKNNAPLKYRKKIRRPLRDEDVLHRY